MSLRRVRKRDGREVPFDEGKIATAIGKAMAAVGEDDPDFAREVAAVVRMTLDQRALPGAAGEQELVPEIEEIQDLVEHALIELGRAAVAKAYILYRDRRARSREALRVRDEAPRSGRVSRLRVHESERTSGWSKGRIVAALMNEAQLSREVAEKVAARVEARVFDSGLERISTALIRELVDNELVELSLDGALKRQTSFGVPLYDLRQMLQAPEAPLDPRKAAAGEELSGRGVTARAGGEVLRRFALQEVLPASAVERHLAGDFHLLELAHPHQMLTCALPAELLQRGRSWDLSPFELLEELARASAQAVHGAVLEDAGALLAPMDERTLGAWLRALTAAARAGQRRLDLCGLDARERGGRAAKARDGALRLLQALAALPDGAFAPRLFAGVEELEALVGPELAAAPRGSVAEAVDQLLLCGRLVLTWSSAEERFVAPGCHRFSGERAAISCGGAVALNLPRLALRAGPWREDRMLELLAGLLDEAVGALCALQDFQLGHRGARADDGRGETRGRIAYAITPVGLREALRGLGDGELRPEQGARLLGYLADASQRLSRRRRVALTLTPFFGERARVRFAQLDLELPQHSQQLLFGEGAGSGTLPGEPYGCGYKLTPTPGCAPWSAEADLLATVPAGALHPLPEEVSRGADLAPSQAWMRFARLRGAGGFERAPVPHAPWVPSLFEELALPPPPRRHAL